MSQPTWDPDNRRWLLDEEDAPAPRRNRRRSVDLIDRPGTYQDPGAPHADRRTGPPSLGAELTRVGFGARDPRPGDPDRTGRGGPERPPRDRRSADRSVPGPLDDGWRGSEVPEDVPDRPWTRQDGGWGLLDPVRPDPLGSERPDHGRDPYPAAEGYDRPRGGRPREDRFGDGDPVGHRSDAPESFRPGEFDGTWRDGLAGPGARGRYGPDGFGREPADRRGARGRDEAPGAEATGRRAAPAPGPFDANAPAPERRPRPPYEPDATPRVEATGRRAAAPPPGAPAPGYEPGRDANGYGPRARTDVARGRGPGDPGPYGGYDEGRHGQDVDGRYGPAAYAGDGVPGRDRAAPGRYADGAPGSGDGRPGRHGPDARGRNGHGPDAYAPGAGPDRTGRHGEVVPAGFGPEEFDADGYNLDGLGRDGYGRDGFDLYGFDREGFDRHGFDREGYDRDGYPVESYEDDEYETGYDPRYDDGYDGYDEGYGYASGYARDGYHRPGRGAYDDGGYDEDGYDDAGPEGTTLADGEMTAVEAEPREGRTRAARRGTGTKERRRWPWVVGAAAVAGAVAVPVGMSLLGSSSDSSAGDPPLLSGSSGTAGLGASGAAQSASPGAPADGAAQPAAAQVTFEVNGSGKAGSITFGRGASVAQTSGVDLPWTQNSPGAEGPSDYTLAATSGGGGGELSCRILVGGAVIAEDSAKGDYAAVSCNGRR